jgi:RNA polymerase sigma-70 factor (ECF subfamily)
MSSERSADGATATADPHAAEVALLQRLAGGEREAPLAELYRLYGRRLYALGMRMLGDGAAAEDLVQDTFVKIWRGADRYDPSVASPRTWILLMARRSAIDLHRRASARPQRAFDEGEAADLPADRDEYERALTGIDVRGALDSLSDKHREVLELGYRQQLTQTEIAGRLGVPLGTVKTRTFHALRELRTQLEELRLL